MSKMIFEIDIKNFSIGGMTYTKKSLLNAVACVSVKPIHLLSAVPKVMRDRMCLDWESFKDKYVGDVVDYEYCEYRNVVKLVVNIADTHDARSFKALYIAGIPYGVSPYIIGGPKYNKIEIDKILFFFFDARKNNVTGWME